MPFIPEEAFLEKQGYFPCIGVDEVGVGALAGPVVACAVWLSPARRVRGIMDSKAAEPEFRSRVAARLRETAVKFSIGSAEAEEVDALGIRAATHLALKRAIAGVPEARFALIDGYPIPGLSIPQLACVKGDRFIRSVAAASMIAKDYRDRLMRSYDLQFPPYGFKAHFGYGTKFHQEKIVEFGLSPIHRKTFLIR